MAERRRREYLQLLDAAKAAAETAIDAFNRVWHPYRYETTLILLTNGWELLGKAVLLSKKETIYRGQRGETISAEVAVHRLQIKGMLDERQAQTIQQIISLRNAACHHMLPEIPPEIMQHLLFYSTKFCRELVGKYFPTHLKTMSENYLSLSFSELTTYADKVQRSVSRVKKSANDKRLIWLLERGIEFDGSSYLTEKQVEQKYRGKKKILPHLAINQFVRNSEMVKIVPIQAPRNYTADVSLRKGSAADSSLPVLVKKTDVEVDFPFLTKEVAAQIGNTQNWTSRAITVLGLKGNPKYHQAVRSGSTTLVHRYSSAAVQFLKHKMVFEPTFDPYHAA